MSLRRNSHVKKLVSGLGLAAAMALAAGPVGAAAPYHLPKSPGQYCKGVSKKKRTINGVKEKKSPFAQCVVGVAQVNKNNDIAPAKACKAASKKKAGLKRSPFSSCVASVKKAKNDL